MRIGFTEGRGDVGGGIGGGGKKGGGGRRGTAIYKEP